MNTRTRNALRASLKQEDVALEQRLPEPAATRAAVRPGTEAPALPAKPGKVKPEKRRRESFSLVAGDLHRLDALRAAMKAAGRPARKSELVRAGLAALAALAALTQDDAIALLDALPPLKRAGGKKKSSQRKATARKR